MASIKRGLFFLPIKQSWANRLPEMPWQSHNSQVASLILTAFNSFLLLPHCQEWAAELPAGEPHWRWEGKEKAGPAAHYFIISI